MTLKLWHLPRVHWRFWSTVIKAWWQGEVVPYEVVYLANPKKKHTQDDIKHAQELIDKYRW